MIQVVGLKNGNVNSYRIDKHEPQKIANFWSFATERWDMLFGKLIYIHVYFFAELSLIHSYGYGHFNICV
jgi:hypothetical protein